MQNFPGGACPQTPLDLAAFGSCQCSFIPIVAILLSLTTFTFALTPLVDSHHIMVQGWLNIMSPTVGTQIQRPANTLMLGRWYPLTVQ